MSNSPKYSKYEVAQETNISPEMSPIYRAADTYVFDKLRKAQQEFHIRRKNGETISLSIEQLETTIDVYFEMCSARKKLPTPAGLCATIGINHKQLLKLLKQDNEQGLALQGALEVMHAIYQEAVIEGTIPVKVYTFMAKNYWGMTDKEIVEIRQEDGDVKMAEIDSRLNRLKMMTNKNNEQSIIEVHETKEIN